MTDGQTPDLRWLAERVDRNHAETTADIADLKAAIAAIPAAMDRYVLQRVYDADQRTSDARFKRLEDAEAGSRAQGRSWVLGIAMAIIGAAAGICAQLLTARGH